MDSCLTFVIPSVGRPTLNRTLDSILKQTHQNWKAIVGFDGILKNELSVDPILDERIQYIHFKDKLGILKDGGITGSSAGLVRNKIINEVSSDWIGFVDDDDSLYPNYLHHFFSHDIDKIDCFIFRMIYPDGVILPRINSDVLFCGNVGISFICNLNFLKKHKLYFEQSTTEDFVLIQNISKYGGKIFVSENVGYKVAH